jgi:hypothetical protein
VAALLDRAVAAGQIRSDIGPEDLLRALVGMCYMHDQPGWQATVLRLVDVFVDGLCVQTRVNRQTTVVPRRGEVAESVRGRLPNADLESAASKRAAMARAQGGSAPEVATAAGGSALSPPFQTSSEGLASGSTSEVQQLPESVSSPPQPDGPATASIACSLPEVGITG